MINCTESTKTDDVTKNAIFSTPAIRLANDITPYSRLDIQPCQRNSLRDLVSPVNRLVIGK